ncbi:MAG TPA: signal recognition particle protein, partial [Succinivibrionaceae bacterium]|nr:signal recognition particle protein [Succinivibrionaceae bacterium]
MFENLTARLNRTLKNLSGKGRITEENIKDTLREVRTALLEADVALPVVKNFTNRVKERTLGTEVNLSLTPGQEFIKAVYAELVETMGGENSEISLAHQPPAVLLLAGLQGAGKTTSAAKLAIYLKERLKKKVLLVSVDTYRPAAMDQLSSLAKEAEIDNYPSNPKDDPRDIAKAALEYGKLHAYDVLILDTAGRLAVDEVMMDEVKALHQLTEPTETLFVVDAMTGQDAVNVASNFNDKVGIDGVILTKLDGDTR